MNYTVDTLRKSMSDWNTENYLRFQLVAETNEVRIKGYNNTIYGSSRPLYLTEEGLQNLVDTIDEFGYLKKDSESFGDQLQYKELRWDDLTKEQKESFYMPYKDSKYFGWNDNIVRKVHYAHKTFDDFLRDCFENNVYHCEVY